MAPVKRPPFACCSAWSARPAAASRCWVRPCTPAHALWARVGYLVEAPAAYAELTVRDKFEIARRLRHLADRRAVDRAIDRLGLAPYADRPAGTLSLGNAQRLGLAKALLHDPA